MTYLKNKISIMMFTAILVAWPLTATNAFGDGDATLDADCPVTIPASINMGNFAIGADGTEVLSTMATDGTVGGTLELSAGDWKGVGTSAKGTIVVVGIVATETVTVNSLVYTAVAGAKSGNTQFSIDTSDTATATDLAASINSRDGAAVTAVQQLNAILLKADTLGTGGNSFTLAETVTDAGTTISGATFAGAEATGVVHMQAEATKFVITTDGTTNAGVAYASKTAIGVDGVNTLLTANVDIANDVKFYMHISGVGTLEALPYSGALTQVLTFTVTCN